MPKRTDLESILLIGSGPIIIGQACEFDYSGTQACKALREEGYEVVLVNSNPATIMTDPSSADRTYIEPLTWEIITKVIEQERPDALLPTLGGQTGLNVAMDLWKHGVLEKYGVEMIGAPGPRAGRIPLAAALPQPGLPARHPAVRVRVRVRVSLTLTLTLTRSACSPPGGRAAARSIP